MSTPGPDAAAGERPATIPEPPRTAGQVLKDIALFFASPFVTIAYLALFPFIGFSMLRRTRRLRRNVS